MVRAETVGYDVSLLPLIAHDYAEGNAIVARGLVLAPTGKARGQYRRIGVWQHLFGPNKFDSNGVFFASGTRKNSEYWDKRFYMEADPVKGFVVEIV